MPIILPSINSRSFSRLGSVSICKKYSNRSCIHLLLTKTSPPHREGLQFCLFSSERQECDVARTLDGNRYLTLMFSAVAGNTAGQNLAALRNEATEFCHIFIVDMFDLVYAERADLSTRSSASVTSHQSNSLLTQNGISSSGMDGPKPSAGADCGTAGAGAPKPPA